MGLSVERFESHCLIHRWLACCSIFSDQTHVTRYASEPVSIGESTPSKKLISDTALTLLFALSAFGFMCALCGGDLRNPANRSTRHHNHTPGRTHQKHTHLSLRFVLVVSHLGQQRIEEVLINTFSLATTRCTCQMCAPFLFCPVPLSHVRLCGTSM